MPHRLLDADPASLSGPLRALLYDAQGDWEAAHEAAQAGEDRESAWVHAYLHRKEGDNWNAAYWYRRAGKPPHRGTLQDEWGEMVTSLSAPSAKLSD